MVGLPFLADRRAIPRGAKIVWGWPHALGRSKVQGIDKTRMG